MMLLRLPRFGSVQVLVFSFVAGFAVGMLFRFCPSPFLSVGLDVAKFNILGKIFIDLIKMIIGPLIFCSVASSALSATDGSSLTGLVVKTVLIFLFFTAIAVLLGLGVATYFNIGSEVVFDKQAVIDSFSDRVSTIKTGMGQPSGVSDFLLHIIPSNVVDSFLRGDFLQIIFFAAFFAIAVLRAGPAAKTVAEVTVSFSAAIFALSDIVMKFTPLAIFGITSWLVGTQNLALIRSLGVLIFAYYACIVFILYPLYGLSLLAIGLNPLHFFKKMLPVQFVGFVTASSAATVGMAIERSSKKFGVSPKKANFIISLGATINMNGGAVYFGMCSVFIANLWGVTLSPANYVTIFFLSILSAVGTAPVAGAAMFLLAGILSAVGLPVDGIAIILAVDRILDMMRTVCNVTGDSLTAVIVDRLEGGLDKSVYVATGDTAAATRP